MEQLGLPPETMRRRVEETLDLLGIADLRHRDLRTLSGGQQQRVAIGSGLTLPRRLPGGQPGALPVDPPGAPPIVELGRAAGWSPLPLSVRDARRRARDLRLA